MAHDIIDNKEVNLLEVIKEKLSVSKRARFAVGFLFLNGFRELKDQIDKLEKLQILAGSRTNRETVEALKLSRKYEKAVSDILESRRYLSVDERSELLNLEFKELVDDLSYIEPTPENIDFLRWFLDKLREGKIEIRIYYKEPLHAKLYLFEYKDPRYGLGEAILGSSNFSLSGFKLNTELNVRITGDENYEKLLKWFKERWDESESTDFTPLAEKAIEESWAFNSKVTPFRIYLRVLHEIFSEQEEEPVIDIEVDLYRFQRDAVIGAYRKLKKYGGVFISDVPGLGKTYIGAALLSHLETEGKKAIVVAPPRLVNYWEEVLADFGVAKAKVFSSGKLSEILENEKYLNRDVVLVDESHHFRNPDTLKFRDLAEICRGKDVILLTATPQNLSIWDIYWQLKLFTPYEVNHEFRIYPIELKEYFKKCENGEANIEDLVSQIFIRRTRSDIKEYYPDEKIVFPEREGPFRVDYSIDKVYPGGLYQKLRELINKLTYARYNLQKYAKEEKFDPDEFQRLTVAWRNLQRLVRINLYRRLESSVEAFRETVHKHIKTYENFKKLIEKESKIFVGDVDEIEEVIEVLENGEDVNWEEGGNYFDAEKFWVEDLLEDLENDLGVFREMYDSVKDIKPEDDDKLQKLIQVLHKPEVYGKKVVIFSVFETTVKYLYGNLRKKFDKVDYISGGEKILTKIKRFAPKANKAKIKEEDEINILISTEVLSEGLNLQDGQVVINYELHWNPVRLIQRIGRIDRIGSEHDEIYVFNFFPETQAEKEIKIETKVSRRIEEIIQNFGYDEKTVSMDEPTVRKKLFEIYTERPEALEEPEDRSLAKYYELEFHRLTKKYPEEYRTACELPAMVSVARKSKHDGIVVFLKADDYYRLRWIDSRGNILGANDWEILRLLECDVNEKREKFSQVNFEAVRKVKDDFEKEANKREQDKFMFLDPVKAEFERFVDWLKRRQPMEIRQRLERLAGFVRSKELDYHQRKLLRRLVRQWRKKFGLNVKEILEELEKRIYPALEKALPLEEPIIEPKYAQIIIAEELI